MAPPAPARLMDPSSFSKIFPILKCFASVLKLAVENPQSDQNCGLKLKLKLSPAGFALISFR